jgi:hypothetical protein
MAAFRRSWTLGSVVPPSGENHNTLDLLSGSGFIEAMWETLIALAIAAAISIGLISLSAHLNEAKILGQVGASPMQAEHRLPSVANVGPAETASHYN